MVELYPGSNPGVTISFCFYFFGISLGLRASTMTKEIALVNELSSLEDFFNF